MNLGAAEILVICVVALLVFGPQRLPEIARQVGGAMRELRKMQDSVKSELQERPRRRRAAVRRADLRPAARLGAPANRSPTPSPTTPTFPPPDDSGFAGPTGSFS